MQRRHALLEIAGDIFDDHNRIVHHEARRNGKGHERKIVDAVVHRYITPNVPIRETGTATLGIKVARTLRRKTKTTRMTSEIEMIRVRSTSCTEARMVAVRSIAISVSMAEGIEAFSCGSAARMRSTVSMMLAPGWRKIMMRTEGLPLTKPAARMFSVGVHGRSPTSEI